MKKLIKKVGGFRAQMVNQKGFSLTEILVTIGLLAIISSIATVGYTSYVNTGEKQAIRTALNKMDSAFNACMSFNKFDGSKCDTPKKIGFEKSPKHKTTISKGQNDICLTVKKGGLGSDIAGKAGLRACIQYQNGQMIRKCFENKTNPKTRAYCNTTGVCCSVCNGACEVGMGVRAPPS